MVFRAKNILTNINLIVIISFILLSYPLLYFSYKFCLPDFGGQDFYSYYFLYKDWDFEKIICPHNMRLLSAYCIHMMYKLGFYYDTEVVFTTVHPYFDQKVFFNAILFNYICVVSTCLMLYHIVLQYSGNKLFSFFSGVLYLLGFGTLFFSLKPLTEACGILLMAICFFFYLQKSPWIFILFPLALFQREYIFMVLGIISLIDFYFLRIRYLLLIFISSLLFFAVFLILRKTLFYTPHFDYQMSPDTLLNSILHPFVNWTSFIKQSLLLSNLLFLYFFVIIYKRINNFSVSKNYFVNIILLLMQVLLMGIMIQGAENMGRIFYYTTPILIFYLFMELKPLFLPYIYSEK